MAKASLDARTKIGGREHLVLINGTVKSDLLEKESGGLLEFLSDLLED